LEPVEEANEIVRKTDAGEKYCSNGEILGIGSSARRQVNREAVKTTARNSSDWVNFHIPWEKGT
jgi:hypothetical protein